MVVGASQTSLQGSNQTFSHQESITSKIYNIYTVTI